MTERQIRKIKLRNNRFIEVLEEIPEGWSPTGATNFPNGYIHIRNNKGLFSPERKSALIRSPYWKLTLKAGKSEEVICEK